MRGRGPAASGNCNIKNSEHPALPFLNQGNKRLWVRSFFFAKNQRLFWIQQHFILILKLTAVARRRNADMLAEDRGEMMWTRKTQFIRDHLNGIVRIAQIVFGDLQPVIKDKQLDRLACMRLKQLVEIDFADS